MTKHGMWVEWNPDGRSDLQCSHSVEGVQKKTKNICRFSTAIFTVCLWNHCCVCAAFCAATYVLWNVGAERGPGHLASSAVVLVLDSCCQCQDRLQAWMRPLKRCSETQTPPPRVPHLHSCDIARGYSAGQHRHCHHNSQKMASAACSHDDKWQEASCHSRRAHHGSGEDADSVPKLSDTTARKTELQLWQLAPLHPSI